MIHIIHAREIRRYAHIIHAYGFTMVLWYKPMIYELLVFKQVTRNGIFDSSSVCFENKS